MGLFSNREGITQVKTVIQIDSIDEDLRNGLWNALTIYYFHKSSGYLSAFPELNALSTKLWHNYFKWTLDNRSDFWPDIYTQLRDYFFRCKWFEVYNFIEFIAANCPEESDEDKNSKFMAFCNSVLEQEVSAYRFVGEKITKITSQKEIDEIEEALKDTKSIKNVNLHLETALEKLADKKSPDYRNSIKESISAVEAICNLIAGNKDTTLGQALKDIEKKIKLHGALKSAFNSMYGYTSSADGIRHALLDETNLDFEDAKFMLVSCSAFINYLLSKASKAGINL